MRKRGMEDFPFNYLAETHHLSRENSSAGTEHKNNENSESGNPPIPADQERFPKQMPPPTVRQAGSASYSNPARQDQNTSYSNPARQDQNTSYSNPARQEQNTSYPNRIGNEVRTNRPTHTNDTYAQEPPLYPYPLEQQDQPRRRTLNRQIQILTLISLGLFLLVLLLAYFAFPGLRSSQNDKKESASTSITEATNIVTAAPTLSVTPTVPLIVDPDPQALTNVVPSDECPVIALTFENGPSGANTTEVLRILKEKDVCATFFLVGSQVAIEDPVLLQEMIGNGNEIGNHSYDNTLYTELTQEQTRDQIQRTNDAVFTAIGSYPTVMRPPEGSKNDMVLALSTEMNLPIVNWSWQTNPEDLVTANQTADSIASHVIGNASNGQIVLLHDSQLATVESISLIIDGLKSDGFRFATVSEMLAVSNDGLKTGFLYTKGTFA